MDNEMLQQALNNDPIMHQLLTHKLQNNEPIINPNNIENTITNIIHEYMNDMNEFKYIAK